MCVFWHLRNRYSAARWESALRTYMQCARLSYGRGNLLPCLRVGGGDYILFLYNLNSAELFISVACGNCFQNMRAVDRSVCKKLTLLTIFLYRKYSSKLFNLKYSFDNNKNKAYIFFLTRFSIHNWNNIALDLLYWNISPQLRLYCSSYLIWLVEIYFSIVFVFIWTGVQCAFN